MKYQQLYEMRKEFDRLGFALDGLLKLAPKALRGSEALAEMRQGRALLMRAWEELRRRELVAERKERPKAKPPTPLPAF